LVAVVGFIRVGNIPCRVTPIEKNVGGYDRIARGLLAVVCFVVAVTLLVASPFEGTVNLAVATTAFVAGLGLSFNAVTQRCMANKVLGINTCRVDVED